MTLEQLRIFVAVAEQQHVTRAASELNLTQSATSAAIAALEARYGIKLFDRVGRGIVLTRTGSDFLVEARAVLARAKDATQVLNDLAGLKRGSLSIAASQTVGNYWLPRRVQTFHAAYPGIELKLSISNTEQVARMVREGSADLGLVEGELDESLLTASKIDGDCLILAVGATLYHMRLGMQVVVEDYIARNSTKAVLLILNTFICVALFAAAAYAVLKIAID